MSKTKAMTAGQDVAARPSTYKQLLRVAGLPQLLISSLLTRTASQMLTVGLILFALQRYHSPSVAGLSLFLLIFPGLLLSPVAGALLDRHGRKRLMTLDFIVAAVCMSAIVALAATNHLPVWGLYVLLVCCSVTSTLSIAGARSFFPLLVPRDLWDRGNAADSVCYGVAAIAGPGLAGLLIAVFGSELALLGAAIGFIVGAVVLQAVPEPVAPPAGVSGRILARGLAGPALRRRQPHAPLDRHRFPRQRRPGHGDRCAARRRFPPPRQRGGRRFDPGARPRGGDPRRAHRGADANGGPRARVDVPVGCGHGSCGAGAAGTVAGSHRRGYRDCRWRRCRLQRQRLLAAPAPHQSGMVRAEPLRWRWP